MEENFNIEEKNDKINYDNMQIINETVKYLSKSSLFNFGCCETLNDFRKWHNLYTPWFADEINNLLANEEYEQFLKNKKK